MKKKKDQIASRRRAGREELRTTLAPDAANGGNSDAGALLEIAGSAGFRI